MESESGLHAEIRQRIFDHYRAEFDITCPWNGREGKLLNQLLKENPSWTLPQWFSMIRNYFYSDGVTGERPAVWMRHITKYARGPLNQYGRCKETLPMTEAQVGR